MRLIHITVRSEVATMTAHTGTVTEASVASSPTVRSGPRVTLQVLRAVAVLHSLAFLGQPVLAGAYLSGDVDALAIHDANAFVITALDVIQLVCAIAFTWKGRGRSWPINASLAIALAVEVQVGVGYERLLVVHIPLGVSIIVSQILVTVWLFRAAAATARTPRPRKARAQ